MTTAERAAELTSRLLTFARQQVLAPKTIDINALVQELGGLLARTLGSHTTIEMNLADGLWPALADPIQLHNSLINLIVNTGDAILSCRSFMDQTSNAETDQFVAVNDIDQLAPGRYVWAMVTDTGAGMTKEVAEKAFEPFCTTKGVGKGTGLDLSMASDCVKQ